MSYFIKKKYLVLGTLSAIGLSLYAVHKADPAIHYWAFPEQIPKEKKIFLNEKQYILHSDLEKRLGIEIKGEYEDSQVSGLISSIQNINSKNPLLLTSLKEIVVLPKRYEVNYYGLAVFSSKIVLKSFELDLIAHEIGHTYSFSQPKEFWNSWEEISKGHYKHNTFPELFDFIYKVFPNLTKTNADFTPKNGLLTENGSKNKYEDVAEFTEDIFTGYKMLSTVSLKEKPLFEKKMDLLLKYDFISKQMYDEAKLKLSSNSLK